MGRDQHVVMQEGRWAVQAEGAASPTAVYRTQARAWERCKAIARKERASAILHGRDGTVRARASYGPEARGLAG